MKVVDTLLGEGLVACCNLIPIRSRYVWKGELCAGEEVGALFKTRADLLAAAVARLEALHPYEAPAIAGWSCDAAAGGTLDWLSAIGPSDPDAA